MHDTHRSNVGGQRPGCHTGSGSGRTVETRSITLTPRDWVLDESARFRESRMLSFGVLASTDFAIAKRIFARRRPDRIVRLFFSDG